MVPGGGPHRTLEVGDTLGPYRLEAVLGEGRSGVVYRAVRAPEGETVALKVLRADLSGDETYRRRFMREGDVATALRDRHLVPVLERGEIGGRHFLASRFVPGRSLAERVAEDGPLSARELVRVVSHVASALDALHRRAIFHRDVKPSNVLLDEHGAAALTDFGVAKGKAHSVLTKQGRVVGTVDYLAPEVISGQPAQASSDIYALGCVAYECVAGAPPFADAENIAAVCIAHLTKEPADPAEGRDDIPSEMTEMLLTALAKDPARRPPSAAVYARVLRASTKSR